ncbi:MAG: ATP-binding protein [Ginsengibacter sp.]
MKQLFLSAIFFTSLTANSQQHQLIKQWETDTVIAVPESVLPDLQNHILYVSLINGGGWDADGIGGVGEISADGRIIDTAFITGLNAPKGLGKFGNHLYAADIDEVVVIDLNKGKVEKKIAIPGAQMLNDITVSDEGVVYVSDSKTSKIWRIENDLPTLFLDNINGANGLKAMGDDLIFAKGKLLMKANANKEISQITEVTEGIDGIEPVGNGDFLASSWVGYIYYVYADGHFETLLETHQQQINAADIGYDPEKRMVYVPTFLAKKVVAYKLQ